MLSLPGCRAPLRRPYNPTDDAPDRRDPDRRDRGMQASRYGHDSQGSDYGHAPLYAHDAPQQRQGAYQGDRYGCASCFHALRDMRLITHVERTLGTSQPVVH